MQTEWNLSYLYSGFDDPAFASDLENLKSLIRQTETDLKNATSDADYLTLFVSRHETVSCLMEKLYSYCELTLSADASNTEAEMNLDQVMHLVEPVRPAQSVE